MRSRTGIPPMAEDRPAWAGILNHLTILEWYGQTRFIRGFMNAPITDRHLYNQDEFVRATLCPLLARQLWED